MLLRLSLWQFPQADGRNISLSVILQLKQRFIDKNTGLRVGFIQKRLKFDVKNGIINVNIKEVDICHFIKI